MLSATAQSSFSFKTTNAARSRANRGKVASLISASHRVCLPRGRCKCAICGRFHGASSARLRPLGCLRRDSRLGGKSGAADGRPGASPLSFSRALEVAARARWREAARWIGADRPRREVDMEVRKSDGWVTRGASLEGGCGMVTFAVLVT